METKKWYESITIWGGVVAIGSAVANAAFGVYIDEQTQNEIAQNIMTVVGAIGGIAAIYGRLKAEKKIGK